MSNLKNKYFDDSLSHEELPLLREKIASQSDEAIGKMMLEKWEEFEIPDKNSYYKQTHKIKDLLDNKITEKKVQVRPAVFQMLLVTASVLIPLLLFSTIYFYKKTTLVSDNNITIKTAKGERVNIVLSDGTAVYINSESTLSYNPKTFNKKQRQLSFEGEAYFSVTKNPEAPFIVNTNIMKLKVLGTKFNLKSRYSDPNIIVSLREGHVQLFSKKTGDAQELFINERGLLNKGTGKFTVHKHFKEQDIAWTKGDLVFNKVSLSNILKTLEREYDVHFIIKSNHFKTEELFTGTVPINNIYEVIRILEHSWEVFCEQNGKNIIIKNK